MSDLESAIKAVVDVVYKPNAGVSPYLKNKLTTRLLQQAAYGDAGGGPYKLPVCSLLLTMAGKC